MMNGKTIAAALAFLVLTNLSGAADYTWDGGTKQITDSNWNSGQATPFNTTVDGRTTSSGNNILIDSGTAQRSGNKLGFTNGTLTIGGTGALEVLSGSSAGSGRFYLGTNGIDTDSRIIVDGGGSIKSDFGFCVYNNAVLQIKSGTVTASGEQVYFQSGTISVEGGLFDFSNSLTYLKMAEHPGTLNISGGEVKGTYIQTNGQKNTINISGGKTTLSGTNNFQNNATLTISGGENSFANVSFNGTAKGEISGGENHFGNSYINVNANKTGTGGVQEAGLFISGGVNKFDYQGINVANSGTGYMSVSGGETYLTLNLNVGNGGTGRVDMSKGDVSAQNVRVGNNSGAIGTMNMSGGTLTVRSGSGTDGFMVGNNGTGTFNMTGGTLSAVTAVIGNTGVGTATISGGELKNTNYDNSLRVGQEMAGNGTLNITGGKVSSARHFYIGNNGTGALDVSGGLAIMSGSLYFGSEASGKGTGVISGGTISAGQHIVVGQNGTGTLTQTGGTIISGVNKDGFQNFYLGRLAGSNGTYNLYGGEAKVGGTFYVGDAGTGTMNVYVGEAGTGRVATKDFAHNGTINLNEAAPFMLLNTGADGVYKYVEWTGTKSGSGAVVNNTNGILESVTGSNYYGLKFANNLNTVNVFDETLTGISAAQGSVWMDPNMNLYQMELSIMGVADMDDFVSWLDAKSDYDVAKASDASIIISGLENSNAAGQYFGWDFSGYAASAAAMSAVKGQGVPEPSTWALLICGLSGLWYLRRRM